MKKTCFLVFAITLGHIITVSGNNDILSVDKDKIIDLTNKYIALLQKTINQKINPYTLEVDGCFEEPFNDDHTYDLSNEFEKEFIAAYFSDAYSYKNIIELNANTEDLEILPCTYYDPITGKQYTYVKLPKIMVRVGDKKTAYAHYLSINITNPNNYYINGVYKDDATTQQKYIAPCLKETLDFEKQKELAQTIAKKYETVKELYSQAKYIDVLLITEEILLLNPSHQESLDAKEATMDFITTEELDAKIKKFIADEKLNSAETILSLAQKYSLATPFEISKWNRLIGDKKIKMKQDLEFQEAENFFTNEMYQQALAIYTKLSKEDANFSGLQNKITLCQDQDPELIQKRIKKAYDAAVASRKNYEDTFGTYYKYENSGYLEGTNYRFMCLMMIDKDNKKLLSNLGMTGNQAKNLAIKYFYKAREMGINTRDIEILVFTSNFNKLRKN